LFNLVYAYEKTGDKAKAAASKNMLTTSSPDSKWAKLISNPQAGKSDNDQNSPATKKYEEIYNLFIEGQFDQAKNEKKIADSLYGNSHWTPQLLFIESIYYIKQQEDSTAIKVLTDLTNLKDTSMAERAKTMIDVLKRRKEIENYLANLEIKRNEDARTPVMTQRVPAPVSQVKPDSLPVAATDSAVATGNQDSTVASAVPDSAVADTAAAAPVVLKDFTFKATEPHYVVVLLDKVDPVYANEARNAFNRFNKERYYNQQIEISGLQLDERYNLVLEGPFANANAAVDYIDKVKPASKSRILPWLSLDKYSFLIISNTNLELLKSNKDMDAYKLLLEKAIPGKF